MHRRAALVMAIVALGALTLPAAAVAPATHTPARFISGVFVPSTGVWYLKGIVLAKALSADEARVDKVLFHNGPFSGIAIVASAARCSEGHTAADQIFAFRLGSAATRKVNLARPLDETRSLRVRVSGDLVQCTRARAFERVEQGSPDADSAFSRFINVQVDGLPENGFDALALFGGSSNNTFHFAARGLRPDRKYTLLGTTYGGNGETRFMHSFRTNGSGAYFASSAIEFDPAVARARLHRGFGDSGFEVASRSFVATYSGDPNYLANAVTAVPVR